MNQLFESINQAAQVENIDSAALLHDWWQLVKTQYNEKHTPAIAAAMLYGGHAGLLTQSEFEEFMELANKAQHKLQERMAVSQTVRNLHATLNKAKPETNGDEE